MPMDSAYFAKIYFGGDIERIKLFTFSLPHERRSGLSDPPVLDSRHLTLLAVQLCDGFVLVKGFVVLVLHARDRLVVVPVPLPEAQRVVESIGPSYGQSEVVELLLDAFPEMVAVLHCVFLRISQRLYGQGIRFSPAIGGHTG